MKPQWQINIWKCPLCGEKAGEQRKRTTLTSFDKDKGCNPRQRRGWGVIARRIAALTLYQPPAWLCPKNFKCVISSSQQLLGGRHNIIPFEVKEETGAQGSEFSDRAVSRVARIRLSTLAPGSLIFTPCSFPPNKPLHPRSIYWALATCHALLWLLGIRQWTKQTQIIWLTAGCLLAPPPRRHPWRTSWWKRQKWFLPRSTWGVDINQIVVQVRL